MTNVPENKYTKTKHMKMRAWEPSRAVQICRRRELYILRSSKVYLPGNRSE